MEARVDLLGERGVLLQELDHAVGQLGVVQAQAPHLQPYNHYATIIQPLYNHYTTILGSLGTVAIQCSVSYPDPSLLFALIYSKNIIKKYRYTGINL